MSHRTIVTTSAPNAVGRNPGGRNVSHRTIVTTSAPNTVGRNPGGSNVSRRAPCNSNSLSSQANTKAERYRAGSERVDTDWHWRRDHIIGYRFRGRQAGRQAAVSPDFPWWQADKARLALGSPSHYREDQSCPPGTSGIQQLKGTSFNSTNLDKSRAWGVRRLKRTAVGSKSPVTKPRCSQVKETYIQCSKVKETKRLIYSAQRSKRLIYNTQRSKRLFLDV